MRLFVCLEYANLRFYSPERGSYLLTYQELADRIKAADARDAAADRRHAEQVSRHLARRARNLRREE